MAALPSAPQADLTLEQVFQDIADGKYNNKKCYLCGGIPFYTSIFFPKPEEARLIGQPPGKQRIVVYGMCEECVQTYGAVAVKTLIEQKLVHDRMLN